MTKLSPKTPMRIGKCTLDFAHNRIRFDDQDVVIEPLVMKVLEQLCETPGELVSHDSLVQQVWGSEHGTQERLTRAISVLRKVFRSSGQEDGFIETIPKRGYRLTQAPEVDAPIDVLADATYAEEAKPSRSGKFFIPSLLLAAVLVLAVFLGMVLLGEKTESDPDKNTAIKLVIEDFQYLGPSYKDDGQVNAFAVELKTALAEVPNLSLLDDETKSIEDYRLRGLVSIEESSHKIFVQLVRVDDGTQVWAESFRDNGDPVWLESAQLINRFLQVRLGLGVGAGRVEADGIDAEAYEHYLRGIALWAERKESAARRKAIVSLRLAVETQADFADALARYGIALTLSHSEATGLNRADADRAAEQALTRALEIEPNNARVRIGLSAFELRRKINAIESEMHARRAIEISPETAEAHYVLAMALLAQGQYQEAHLAFDRAIALDPQNVIPRLHKISSLAGRGDVEALRVAINDCERCTIPVYQYLIFIAAMQSGSIIQAQEAIDLYEQSAARAIQHGASKDSVSTRQEFEDLVDIFMLGKAQDVGWQDWMEGASPNLIISCVYAHIGEHDRAARMIEELHQNSAFIETFELISHDGPLNLPEAFLRSEDYKSLWNSSENMKNLEQIRRQNKRIAGLPIY